MTPSAVAQFAAALDALPVGTVQGRAHGRRYIATKTLFNTGRSTKLIAEELGGNDYISLNFYALERGPRVFPCEMSTDKVAAFVMEFVPDQALE